MNNANSPGTVPRDRTSAQAVKRYRTAMRKTEERRAGHSRTFYGLVLGNVQTPKPSSYALTARSGGGADSFEVPSKPQAAPHPLGRAACARQDARTRCFSGEQKFGTQARSKLQPDNSWRIQLVSPAAAESAFCNFDRGANQSLMHSA